jgi:hypothetical protein
MFHHDSSMMATTSQPWPTTTLAQDSLPRDSQGTYTYNKVNMVAVAAHNDSMRRTGAGWNTMMGNRGCYINIYIHLSTVVDFCILYIENPPMLSTTIYKCIR